MMKILFTGGGTAGHIFPIIAILREIKKNNSNLKFYYIGPKDEFSEKLLSQEGVIIKTILTGKIRRYFDIKSLFENIFDILIKVPIGFFQSLFYNFIISPDIIFSKGGYGSFPVVLSGWILLIPIFLHESDVSPGLANKWLSKFSMEIFISFPVEKTGIFSSKKIISIGNPIREELLTGEKEKAKKLFNISGEKPVILILGGSQGSQRINDILLLILPELLFNFDLIHQIGQKNFEEVIKETKAVANKELLKNYYPFSFLDENQLKEAYAISDLIISRAGSGSIFEIAAIGKPSILIPLPESAQNHQLRNAYTYIENETGLIIEEINLTPRFFLERIKYLLSQPEELKKMSKAAKSFSRPQSAKIIAEYLIAYLNY